ncbi:MAG: C40 family peptidase [Cellulomonadaceae bacterium]|nr:C40 family peptidase [Cellulomonadaceae bacterium]
MSGLAVKPDVTTTPKKRTAKTAPVTDTVKVQDTETGVVRTENPLANLVRDISKDEYDAAGSQQVVGGGGKSTDLIAYARQFVGTPYKWGGSSPLGFDCSGFVQYVFRKMGVDLPRVSYQQATYGKRIAPDQLRPGDLVAWDNSKRNNGADHIAIYVGNGMVIEAPKPGTPLRIASMNGRGGTMWGVQMNL